MPHSAAAACPARPPKFDRLSKLRWPHGACCRGAMGIRMEPAFHLALKNIVVRVVMDPCRHQTRDEIAASSSVVTVEIPPNLSLVLFWESHRRGRHCHVRPAMVTPFHQMMFKDVLDPLKKACHHPSSNSSAAAMQIHDP